MPSLKSAVSRFIPAHFNDPVGLAMRLLKTGDPAARFAMSAAALGLAMSPLDLMMAVFERRRYVAAGPPRLPITLVCGPPRSGTTLVALTLIRNLPVSFFNNLSAVFPRAPLTANRWFGHIPQDRVSAYSSYYGRTAGLGGVNDGLHLWDRWLGTDRTVVPTQLTRATVVELQQFFGAFEGLYQQPLIAKNNSLNASAALVGAALPTSRFICLQRDPVYLAQSLLLARREIHGSTEVAYGFSGAQRSDDPVEDVCLQVEHHEDLARRQLELLGPDRFWMVTYEAACRDPGALIDRVAREALGVADPGTWRDPGLKPFIVSERRRLDAREFARLEGRLASRRTGVTP